MSQEKSKEHKNLRFEGYSAFKKIEQYTQLGQRALYGYKSLAIKEAIEQRNSQKNIPAFHPEFNPDFTQYQYDLELYISLNYEQLYIRELQLADKEKLKLLETTGPKYGATFFEKEYHLQNAVRIRWPEKILPDGSALTAYALTDWAKDYLYGLSYYNNLITFGGGGQGKTYSAIAFALMIYEYFIQTKAGAQCSFSTVSEKKLDQSIWSHLNKLHSFRNSYPYSTTAGTAIKAGEFTFIRKDVKGKRIEEGGTMRGILLVKGAQTSKEIDKLTGQHDVIARVYLLDEAQSTGPAPMSAYNNMFIHPKYGWFLMAGNYDLDDDLLGMNTEPISGWDSVDETTHMWESVLRSPESDLGHKSLVIHYNNDLSPAMFDPAVEKKYAKFLPTLAKKKRLYPTAEQENTIACKRFWNGFRYAKKENNEEFVMTREIIRDFNCHIEPEMKALYKLASLDTAPSSTDRNVLSIICLGLDEGGYPVIWPDNIYSIKKPSSQFQFYKESAKHIADICNAEGIKSGDAIMDWTQRTQLLEALRDEYNLVFQHLVYSEGIPDGERPSIVTKLIEKRIEVDTVATYQFFEREVKVYAHEKFTNRITLGAYLWRLWIECGKVRRMNESCLKSIPDNKGFEKEFCLRYFYQIESVSKWSKNIGKVTIDSKDKFKGKYKFSPDILDTLFQAAYFLYVNKGVSPKVQGLGKIRQGEIKTKRLDKDPWDARMRFR